MLEHLIAQQRRVPFTVDLQELRDRDRARTDPVLERGTHVGY